MLFSKGTSKQNPVPDRTQNPPSIHPSIVNERRVPVTIYCKNEETFDEVKAFKDDLKGLPKSQMRFIEVYEEDIDEYYLIQVDDIEKIEYDKDEWDED
ncbi:hypothetical protein ACIPCB_01050 [Pediococcus pentosaceus]|uniref:Uncharacterized protein n=1 Tax=Pediococcus pentosaceus CGMCC 7049 TaxID=1460385 RepID=A0AAU7NJ12_PEDPE|nr:hypothetical protein [Pediococcus pentosaceus]MCV3324959.1 hypothetical protein [Pediococcus pentosaceus]